MTTYIQDFMDFNENPHNPDDPKLVGYLPVAYFRLTDSDRSSRRIRDVSVTIDLLYDFNLEDGYENDETDWGEN